MLEIQKVLKIFARLIADFNNKRAGIPDLIVWNNTEFFFAEVKGEKDKISEKQSEWHHFLTEVVGIKVEAVLINHKISDCEQSGPGPKAENS